MGSSKAAERRQHICYLPKYWHFPDQLSGSRAERELFRHGVFVGWLSPATWARVEGLPPDIWSAPCESSGRAPGIPGWASCPAHVSSGNVCQSGSHMTWSAQL